MPRITSTARRALVAERKAQILTAAAKVFAKKGFERATIAAVAKEASVAEGSIYNYFKNKADLLVSIPRQFMQPAVQPLSAEIARSAMAEHAAPEQMLTMLAHNMVMVATHNTDILRVLLSSLPTLSAAARQKYLEQVPLFALGMLETYFRQQVTAGVFRSDLNPAIAARAFPGTLMVFVLTQEILQAQGAARFDYDEVIAHVVQLFLRGALTPTLNPHLSPPPSRKRRGTVEGAKRERKRR